MLFFRTLSGLKGLQRAGRIQLLFSGKAHPKDWQGKELIKKIAFISKQLENAIKIVYLANYDMELAQRLTAGVDLWLNMPQRPLESSGTFGMKAAHNGVPSLSILDGWWLEGHIEGVTGWAIGSTTAESESNAKEALELYDKLEHIILCITRSGKNGWILCAFALPSMPRFSILNGWCSNMY